MSITVPKHGTSWQDEESAGLNRCGTTKIDDFTMVHTDCVTECPICHAKLRLLWDVRVIEVGSPEDPKINEGAR
jgi:hypothetical protein